MDYGKLKLLPEEQWAIGVGGRSPLYRIEQDCSLTFETDTPNNPAHRFYTEKFNQFDVLKVEMDNPQLKEQTIRNLGSLLGVDLLGKCKAISTSQQPYIEL